jgi:kynurenine formamidase
VRVVDLGHPLAESDPTWDGERQFSWKVVESIEKDGVFVGHFEMGEHFGTHVDAPAHFAVGGVTVDQLPVDHLVSPAVVINVTRQVTGNEDYQLSASDVLAFERAHGTVAPGTIVLVATGWDARWPDAARYLNEREGVKHFPGIAVDAATLLARDRRVAAIGIDTPSVDHGPSQKFETHRVTMSLGIYHIENATGLTSLPATGLTVVVAPIKIAGGSGGPARVFALLEDV